MLKKCGENLDSNGIIVIKENIFDSENDIGQFSLDTDDNSVIRTIDHFERIINEGGFEIVDK
jgi:hypothetical protein